MQCYYEELDYQSHPDTIVGVYGMGEICITHLIRPTKELPEIIGYLYDARLGGSLLLLEAVADVHDVWFGCSGKELGIHLPKRITMFARGLVYDIKDGMHMLGEVLKERNIACEAICFGDPAENKQEFFHTLIALEDNNGNCNHLHVPHGSSSVHDTLLRTMFIGIVECLLLSLIVFQSGLHCRELGSQTSVVFSFIIRVELMTPAFSQYFLLLASIANIAKQIGLACYLAAGSFTIADNLDEVSAMAQ
ncbi:dehydroascorbate reductase 2, partial [Tanacetum coccineum]